MKKIVLILLLITPYIGEAQHTFSIVAVDSITGEIGSAGATCGDSIIWPGTPGAKLISDIIPGIGAIHTQSYHHITNQKNARTRMNLGDSPQEIIDWLVSHDVSFDPFIRQYGIVDFNDGSPRSAAYTGSNCFNYKNHILGSNYAIQGNILLGQQILDSMESRFNNTHGCLSDKLMAAMQGANVVGADTRCTPEGTSSLSAFLRVAKPSNRPDSIFIDLNIAGTARGVEPIDELQMKYNKWKITNNYECSTVMNYDDIKNKKSNFSMYPNPAEHVVFISNATMNISKITFTDILGQVILEYNDHGNNEIISLSTSSLPGGVYFVSIYEDNSTSAIQILTVH